MRRDKDELRGTIDLLVLRTRSTGGTMDGYAMSERIKQISLDVLSVEEGSLYSVAPDEGERLGQIHVGSIGK